MNRPPLPVSVGGPAQRQPPGAAAAASSAPVISSEGLRAMSPGDFWQHMLTHDDVPLDLLDVPQGGSAALRRETDAPDFRHVHDDASSISTGEMGAVGFAGGGASSGAAGTSATSVSGPGLIRRRLRKKRKSSLGGDDNARSDDGVRVGMDPHRRRRRSVSADESRSASVVWTQISRDMRYSEPRFIEGMKVARRVAFLEVPPDVLSRLLAKNLNSSLSVRNDEEGDDDDNDDRRSLDLELDDDEKILLSKGVVPLPGKSLIDDKSAVELTEEIISHCLISFLTRVGTTWDFCPEAQRIARGLLPMIPSTSFDRFFLKEVFLQRDGISEAKMSGAAILVPFSAVTFDDIQRNVEDASWTTTRGLQAQYPLNYRGDYRPVKRGYVALFRPGVPGRAKAMDLSKRFAELGRVYTVYKGHLFVCDELVVDVPAGAAAMLPRLHYDTVDRWLQKLAWIVHTVDPSMFGYSPLVRSVAKLQERAHFHDEKRREFVGMGLAEEFNRKSIQFIRSALSVSASHLAGMKASYRPLMSSGGGGGDGGGWHPRSGGSRGFRNVHVPSVPLVPPRHGHGHGHGHGFGFGFGRGRGRGRGRARGRGIGMGSPRSPYGRGDYHHRDRGRGRRNYRDRDRDRDRDWDRDRDRDRDRGGFRRDYGGRRSSPPRGGGRGGGGSDFFDGGGGGGGGGRYGRERDRDRDHDRGDGSPTTRYDNAHAHAHAHTHAPLPLPPPGPPPPPFDYNDRSGSGNGSGNGNGNGGRSGSPPRGMDLDYNRRDRDRDRDGRDRDWERNRDRQEMPMMMMTGRRRPREYRDDQEERQRPTQRQKVPGGEYSIQRPEHIQVQQQQQSQQSQQRQFGAGAVAAPGCPLPGQDARGGPYSSQGDPRQQQQQGPPPAAAAAPPADSGPYPGAVSVPVPVPVPGPGPDHPYAMQPQSGMPMDMQQQQQQQLQQQQQPQAPVPVPVPMTIPPNATIVVGPDGTRYLAVPNVAVQQPTAQQLQYGGGVQQAQAQPQAGMYQQALQQQQQQQQQIQQGMPMQQGIQQPQGMQMGVPDGSGAVRMQPQQAFPPGVGVGVGGVQGMPVGQGQGVPMQQQQQQPYPPQYVQQQQQQQYPPGMQYPAQHMAHPQQVPGPVPVPVPVPVPAPAPPPPPPSRAVDPRLQ